MKTNTDAAQRPLLGLVAASVPQVREDRPVFAGRTAAERQACEDLAGELASVTYGLDSQGRLVVESKDDMRKRLGHSPDLADGLGTTFGAARPWAGQVVIL